MAAPWIAKPAAVFLVACLTLISLFFLLVSEVAEPSTFQEKYYFFPEKKSKKIDDPSDALGARLAASPAASSPAEKEAPGIDHLDHLPAEISEAVKSDPHVSKVLNSSSTVGNSIWDYRFTGLPGKPLSIKEAEMCAKKRLHLPNGFEVCEGDSSCVGCTPKWTYEKTIKLMAAWKDTNLRERRQRLIQQFEKVREAKEEVTVMAVNRGMIHLWLNWVCGCDRKQIEVRNSTIMIPTDYESYKEIQRAGFLCLEPTWTKSVPVLKFYDGRANYGAHYDVNNVALYTAAELVDAGFNVLLQDVDLVWIHDFRPWLRKAAIGRDIMAQFDNRLDGKGPGNSGFIFFRNTPRTRLFVKTMVNISPIKVRSDQRLFNMLMYHEAFRQVHFEILPISLFNPMYKRLWPLYRNSSLLVHAVSVFKTERLRQFGLYYFMNCKYYTTALDPCFNVSSCKL